MSRGQRLIDALMRLGRRTPPRRIDRDAECPPQDDVETLLGRTLATEQAAHPGLTGIHPLADGRDAFVARAVLADAAERSIDAQYYIWHADTSGLLLLQRLRCAAERGVRVRLLLDDNNTSGLDPLLLGLDAHPNLEVRVFNPLRHRRARLLDYLFDFARVHRRMHNKAFTVDRQITVLGGRNIGDEYFGAGEGVMFADLDVVAVGAVLDAVGADFERYWNSSLAYPLRDLLAPDHPRLELGSTPAADAATLRYLEALAQSDLLQHLQAGHLPLEWAPARLLSDAPDKILDRAPPDKTLLAPLYQAMTETRHTLTLVSPYFVPGRQGAAALAALARRGVSVSVLTNALAATDVSAVHAGYARYRKGLLRAGVRLYELKPGSTVGGGRLALPGRSGTSLHGRTYAMGEAQVFGGSLGVGRRSAELNTEMGLLIDSPALARSLPQALAVTGPESAYALSLDGGTLRWTTLENGQRTVFDREPHASLRRRVVVRILSWLPIEWLL